jgi:hypothetical protein
MGQLGLKMASSRGALSCRLQGHRVAQAFETVHEATFHGSTVALVEVAGPEIVIAGAVAQ